MPRYKNSTGHPITCGSVFFEVSEEKDVEYYIPEAVSGLTKTADAPVPRTQLLQAQSVAIAAAGSQDFEVPYCAGKFSLNIITEGTGTATLTMGGVTAPLSATVGLALSGLHWEHNAKFTVASEAGATVDVLAVEE